MNDERLPVLVSHAYDRIGSFTQMNPYVIAFCYPDPDSTTSKLIANTNLPKKGFIVKGGMNNVEKTLKKYHYIPMLVFVTIWRHGRGRHLSPRFYNFKTDLGDNKTPWFRQSNLRRMGGKSFFRRSTLMFEGKAILSLRRVPRKWLPEYTKLHQDYCFNATEAIQNKFL